MTRWPPPAPAPGIPTTAGTAELRDSAVAALDRRYGITGLTEEAVLPVIGTKELIAWLPTLLGLGPEDVVVVPELAYPTYDVGARLAGARVLRADSLTQLGPQSPALVYMNSPSNPTGRVLGVDHLRKVVGWARDTRHAGGLRRVLFGFGLGRRAAVGAASLSLRRRPYRAAGGALAVQELVAGRLPGGLCRRRPGLVAELLAVRKHAGMMVPTPVQAAMVAALDDDAHEQLQRERYARRRDALLPALRSAGFTVDHSEAGLYLWATRDEPCRDSVAWLAERGILVAPGEFYGPARCAACPGCADRHRRTHRRRGAAAHLAASCRAEQANGRMHREACFCGQPRVRNVVVTTSAGKLRIPLSIGDMAKRVFLGKPLITEDLAAEKLSNTVALGALSPDAISSTAYGPEQIMVELLPLRGWRRSCCCFRSPASSCDSGAGGRVVSAGRHGLHPSGRLLHRGAGQLRAPGGADRGRGAVDRLCGHRGGAGGGGHGRGGVGDTGTGSLQPGNHGRRGAHYLLR